MDPNRYKDISSAVTRELGASWRLIAAVELPAAAGRHPSALTLSQRYVLGEYATHLCMLDYGDPNRTHFEHGHYDIAGLDAALTDLSQRLRDYVEEAS